MLLIVHYNERRLPDQRAALYMKTVDTLLLPDYAVDEEVATDLSGVPSLSREDHRQLLQSLAFEIHRRGEYQGHEIAEHEIKKALKPEFGEPRVSAFIELPRTRGSVLEERQGDYRFAHLGYQEFLAARYLAQDRMEETGLKGVVEFFKAGPIVDTGWREPALLFAGYYAIVNPSTMRRFLESLGLTDEDPPDPDVRLAAAEVAATALLEWDPGDSSGQQGQFAKRILALVADREGITLSQPALRARSGRDQRRRYLSRRGEPLWLRGDERYCWEWTGSLLGAYPYPELAEERVREALDAPRDKPRVLRGGGFNLNPRNIRCASRRLVRPRQPQLGLRFSGSRAPTTLNAGFWTLKL